MSRRSVEEHLSLVRGLLAPVVESIRLDEPELLSIDDPSLLHRVTASALMAPHPLPLFDNSQMDGYAVRVADLADAHADRARSLPIGRTAAAGDAPFSLTPGTASPIMTGAAIPIGADAVVQIEAVDPPRFTSLRRADDPAPTGSVSFHACPTLGQFIRLAGVDVQPGTELLHERTRLTPARIGLLASAGIQSVPVQRKMRVLVCSTGDEIVTGRSSSGEANTDETSSDETSTDESNSCDPVLAPGRIHDANSPMLAAAFREVGADVRTLHSDDDAESLRRALADVASNCDLVVTSGGISAGAFEVVREALEPLGATFQSVAMQPGGPQGLGSIVLPQCEVAALCFPGNPVSSMLSAEVFLLPILREVAGLPPHRPSVELLLAHDVESPSDKLQVRRGSQGRDGRVSLSAPGSHLLSDLANADVLAFIPVGIDHISENSRVKVWTLYD